MRPRFRFEQSRVRKELPVQADDCIRPGARGRAMQNVKSVFAIDFRVRFVERDHMAKRISGVNHAAMFIFDPDVERSVIGKPIRQKRVSSGVAASLAAHGDSYALLPDWPRVGYFNNLGWGIEVAPEIGEINMRPDVVGPEVLKWIESSEINFLGNGLARLDAERFHFLRRIGWDRLTIAAGDFESEPAFTGVVV